MLFPPYGKRTLDTKEVKRARLSPLRVDGESLDVEPCSFHFFDVALSLEYSPLSFL